MPGGRLASAGLRFSEAKHARDNASRRARDDNKRVSSHQAQLRRFEDAGHGVSTGRQHEHEVAMAEKKAKLKAKKAASKAWLASSAANYAGDPSPAMDEQDHVADAPAEAREASADEVT